MSGEMTMKKTVEQLRREAGVDRMKVSQAAEDLQQYCENNANNDALLTGVYLTGNPFKDKKGCTII
ncbi:guanine nucleotide-binding protein G(I)/G(S)/G(O) subunit gamma-7-like [Asterias rubens]|uniref:guanine nucleotide-binding protein G(I)/G(S)/G(O) subunit gamma-7-like n=1 Tax=Asterias rubens TaxID=7604 RepID=UPI0014552206|nr:guanine nucleotide-binding protein G(I)/G(S)/G(O) subunit gamma-7-like [Asterias rubens]